MSREHSASKRPQELQELHDESQHQYQHPQQQQQNQVYQHHEHHPPQQQQPQQQQQQQQQTQSAALANAPTAATAHPAPSFSSVVLPPLQISSQRQPDPFAPRIPAIEPRQSATAAQTFQSPFDPSNPNPSPFPGETERVPYQRVPIDPPSAGAPSVYRPNPSFQPSIRPIARARTASTTSEWTPARQHPQQPAPAAVTLRFRQQPRAARACGHGERDRRVIDPPPIIEVLDSDNVQIATPHSAQLCSVMNVSLWDERGQRDETFGAGSNRDSRLMGTLVASCISADDERGRHGYFFAFPDLSCRNYGRFRLRFALIRLDVVVDRVGSMAPIIAYAMSDVFTVYSASEFPGMRPSSALTIALREQGHNLPIKKGKRSGLAAPEDEAADEARDAPSASK